MELININYGWDKEINISLSLRELQIIHDSIAVISYSECREHWNYFHNKKLEIPYLSEVFYSLYDNLENIIKLAGGCADND